MILNISHIEQFFSVTERDDEDENNILKCKYAALHSELASSRKENSVLKKKIRRDAQLRKELSTVKREKAAIERNFQHQQECMIQENHQLLKDLSKEKKEKAILDKKFQELTLSVAQKESQLRKEISRVEKEKAVIETKLKKLQDIVKVCEDRLEEITNNLNTTKNDLAIRLVLADNF